jgi:negative regulator of flagellin synthesis FlgM
MKIDNSIKVTAPNTTKASGQGQRSTLSKLMGDNGVHDEVELSGKDTKLRDLEAQLAELEVTDAGKIEAIRRAIADGTFKVDENAVADGLIGEAINLLSGRNR